MENDLEKLLFGRNLEDKETNYKIPCENEEVVDDK